MRVEQLLDSVLQYSPPKKTRDALQSLAKELGESRGELDGAKQRLEQIRQDPFAVETDDAIEASETARRFEASYLREAARAASEAAKPIQETIKMLEAKQTATIDAYHRLIHERAIQTGLVRASATVKEAIEASAFNQLLHADDVQELHRQSERAARNVADSRNHLRAAEALREDIGYRLQQVLGILPGQPPMNLPSAMHTHQPTIYG